ncbi:MAG: M48 family metalloprotease [bacterium]
MPVPPSIARRSRSGLCPKLLLIVLALASSVGCAYRSRSPGTRINYEESIGREFALEASGQLRLMDEPEILDFTRRVGERLSSHITGSPYSHKFFVIREPTMNAFAVPGGYIYVFAGLLSTVRTEDELAGVLAHELNHVEGNHFIRGQKKLDVTNIATVAATILAAALGGGEQAVAAGTLAQAVQMTTSLHYSREFEREADRGAIPLMRLSGFDPQGISSLFHTFQDEARLNAADLPPYFYTHPLPSERIYEVNSWINATPSSGAVRLDPIRGFDKARVTAKLRTQDEQTVISEQEAEAMKAPADARAQFLLGYLYLKLGNLPLATHYLEKAYQLDSRDPDHALYLGQAHHLAGRMKEAREMVSTACELDPSNVIAEVCLGDLLMQGGDREKQQALFHFQRAATLDPRSSFAQSSLAMACGRLGQTGKSYFHLGLAYKNAGEYLRALHYFKKAVRQLDSSSPEAKQAQEEIKWMEGE